ncbi:MAG: carbohydrate binding family 9 domain-containing protein [Deltaproteobacteria bacterium]|nr:carbohydrate binding family 9 domain-containing protein [Deltaproteobacteria bacterium]
MAQDHLCVPSSFLAEPLGRFSKRLGFIAFLLASCPLYLGAADDLPPKAPGVQHSIPVTTEAIEIDGSIDESAWSNALSIPLLWETDPGENLPAPVETECLLTYDLNHLYVAFRALDPDPQKIRARLADRDQVFSDDFVGIILDTFNDERRAFQFFVNPRGVQMDVFLDQVNDREDPSWDAIWDSAGRITPEGYEVELAIPFSSLRFPHASGPQTWGLDALRFWPRNSRHRLTNVSRDRNNSCHLCQLSKISGFEGITPGRNIEITPTLTAARLDLRSDFPHGELENASEDTDAGLTLRWGITPNLILSGTVNPDFSQIESDSAQLGINEQFALFFPERRPFFLEGADFFESPLRAIFTRNVADPDWGVKLSGKQGKSAFGVFAAQDKITNLLFPGSQGSQSTSLDLETFDGALRFRRDLGASSALGVMATSREGDGYSNRVYGFDGLWRGSESDRLRFQWLSSSTTYPDAVAEEFNQPNDSFQDQAFKIAYNHDARNWEWYASYDDIGEDFRADLGFLPRVGYTFLLGGLKRIWWGEEEDWFNRLSFGGDWDLTRDQSGNTLEREAELFFNYDGPKQSEVFLGLGTRERFFNGVTFDENYVNSFLEIQPTGDLELSLWFRAGDDIDFANTRPGEILRLNPEVRYDLGRRLRLNLEHDFRRLDVEGGTLFEANLSQLKAIYQFNRRTFVRTILQLTDIERDPGLFVESVEAKTEQLLTQLLFSYKINPQTVFFLGYSDTSAGNTDVSLTRTDRTFFFKVGYAWVL